MFLYTFQSNHFNVINCAVKGYNVNYFTDTYEQISVDNRKESEGGTLNFAFVRSFLRVSMMSIDYFLEFFVIPQVAAKAPIVHSFLVWPHPQILYVAHDDYQIYFFFIKPIDFEDKKFQLTKYSQNISVIKTYNPYFSSSTGNAATTAIKRAN